MDEYVLISHNFFIDGACADMKGEKGKTCKKKLEQVPKNEFSIHGLWPGKLNGDFVECGGTLTTDMIAEAKTREADIFNKMNNYWVSYSASDEAFWIHEYEKHGYCYSYKHGQDDFVQYFKDAMAFFLDNKFNEFFLKAFPGVEKKTVTISKKDLRKIVEAFYPGAYINFICDSASTKSLSQIYFYFDINYKPYPVPFAFNPNCGQEEEPITIIFN